MKVFLYLKHFPLTASGLNQGEGTRKAVHGLAAGLVAAGADVTVLCEGAQEAFTIAPAGYEIACFATDEPAPSFSIAPGLKTYLRQHGGDGIVVLNGIFHRSVFGLSRVLRRYSIPYVVAPHDPYHPSIFRKNAHLKYPYWLLCERRLLRQARAIQVLDLRHGELLRRLRVTTPVFEVPDGFAGDDVPDEGALVWREEGAPRLFFLGRLDAHNKGLDLLLSAFADIARTSDAELVIQGPDGGDRAALETQAGRLGLSHRVRFLEPDSTTPSSTLIASHDVFCIPSRFEGFGLSPLEAMLAGRVVLVSEIAGIAPHVVASGCGVVVTPDSGAIAAGCRRLLERRSEWQTMGLEGRRYALENLDWRGIAERALGQYRHLVAP